MPEPRWWFEHVSAVTPGEGPLWVDSGPSDLTCQRPGSVRIGRPHKQFRDGMSESASDCLFQIPSRSALMCTGGNRMGNSVYEVSPRTLLAVDR